MERRITTRLSMHVYTFTPLHVYTFTRFYFSTFLQHQIQNEKAAGEGHPRRFHSAPICGLYCLGVESRGLVRPAAKRGLGPLYSMDRRYASEVGFQESEASLEPCLAASSSPRLRGAEGSGLTNFPMLH